MKYQLTKFNNICKLLFESFKNNSFDILNTNAFPKAHKYNNFPEGNDIDITNELDLTYFKEIKSVILSKHCIKSETNDDIHGINYINISKNRFYKYIINTITKILNTTININNEEQYFKINIKDNKIKNDFCFIIKTIPINHSLNLNIVLITIFYRKFENSILLKTFNKSDHGKLIINHIINSIINESVQIPKFYEIDLAVN